MISNRLGALRMANGGSPQGPSALEMRKANRPSSGPGTAPTPAPQGGLRAGASPQEIVQEMTGYDPEFPKRPLASPLMYDERTGTYEWGIPQLAIEGLERVVLPGAVLQGYQPAVEDVVQMGLDVGMLGAPVGAFARPAGSAVLGMGAGRVSPKQQLIDRPLKTKALPPPEAIAINPVLYGDEFLDVPQTVSKTGRRSAKVKDVAAAAEARTQSRLGGQIIGPKDYNDETADYLSSAFAEEARAAGKQGGNAATWYRDKLVEAGGTRDMIYNTRLANQGGMTPELRNVFNYVLAVTSNGADVASNSQNTFKVFDEFLATGKLPDTPDTVPGSGKAKKANLNAFRLHNEMVDKMGLERWQAFLNADINNKMLKDAGLKMVTGEGMATPLKGSAILGPKIGQGFYQNLTGNYDPLTSDLWWMRGWGRMTGNLLEEVSPALQQKRFLAFKNELGTPDAKRIMGELGIKRSELKSKDDYNEAARRVYAYFNKGGFEDNNAFTRAAKVFRGEGTGVIEYPSGSAQRLFMRDVADRAVQKLQGDFPGLKPADFQALLWYPEKNLYDKYGAVSARAKPTDYATEFAKIAKERGFDLSNNGDVRAGGVSFGGGRGGPGDPGVLGVDGPAGGGGYGGQAGSVDLEAIQHLRDLAAKGVKFADGGRASKDPAQIIDNVTYRQAGPGAQLAYGPRVRR
jgi:hypothetical protein